MNVPPMRLPRWRRAAKKLMFTVLAIYAPELIVSYGAIQLLHARELTRFRNDFKEKSDKSGQSIFDKDGKVEHGRCCPVSSGQVPGDDEEEWALEHGFFAYMGGFLLKMDEQLRETMTIGSSEYVSLTPAGYRLLIRNGLLPAITKRVIRAKSKPSYLLQAIVFWQALWIVLSILSRVSLNLPATLLEITTVAQICASFVVYTVWWHKPQNISDPIIINFTSCPTCLLVLRKKNFSQRHIRTGYHPEEAIPSLLRGETKITVIGNTDLLALFIAIIILIYGAIHLSAWNSYFPTAAEQMLWRVATCVMTGVALIYLVCALVFFWGARDDWRVLVLQSLGTAVYVVARTVLVVLSFVGLREVPLGVYETISWVNQLPHIG